MALRQLADSGYHRNSSHDCLLQQLDTRPLSMSTLSNGAYP